MRSPVPAFFILGLALVFFLSWQPQPQVGLLWFIPEGIARWADAAEHDTIRTGVPFVFLGLLNGWWLRQRAASWRQWLTAVGGLSLAVGLAEVGQAFFPLRSFDWRDIAWGVAGSLVGMGVAVSFYALRPYARRRRY